MKSIETNIESLVCEYIKEEYSDRCTPSFNYQIEGTGIIADAYLENGSYDKKLRPKTVIEIKRRLYYNSLYQLNKQAEQLQAKGYNLHLIFLDAYELSGSFIDDFLKSGENSRSRELKYTIELVSPNKLQKYSAERSQEKTRILAIEAFAEKPVTLFLGAGVSQSGGLPSWEDLLKALKRQAQTTSNLPNGIKYKELCNDCGNSPIILGRFLKQCLQKNEKLEKSIHNILYENYSGRKSKHKRDVIDVICEWIASKKIESIITYNYDDLIEQTLRNMKVEGEPIYTLRPPTGKFPIYHVHGFVPYDAPLIKSNPVLSEKEYHDFYNQSYNWANVEQLHALNRSTCFFIGHSMTDPNLRRLLDIAQGVSGEVPEVRHFVIMEDSNICGHFLCKSSVMSYKQQIEDTLERMGVRVIWYRGFENLPDVLDKIAGTKK